MTWSTWALDGAVVLLLLGLAARIVFTRDLFEAIVLFIAFGLTLSLAWVRLAAPDLALAEAALGAGVTGALLLNAYGRLREREAPGPAGAEASAEAGRTRRDAISRLRGVLGGVVGALAAGFAVVLPALPGKDPDLAAKVADRLGEAGVSNPVTAVLLNFRAYDTLLEVALLVVAMVAVWAMDRGTRVFARAREETPGVDRVLKALIRLVVPAAGLTAVYLVWIGSRAPGGAFQAAALLAGVGVLLLAARIVRPVTAATPLVRALGVTGLGALIVVGLATMARTGTFLTYPEGTAPRLVFLLESVLAVSIAVILLELFVDVPAVSEADPNLERVDPTGDPLGRSSGPDREPGRGAVEDP